MGFTLAAWDVWGNYDILGKTVLTLWSITCHFLVSDYCSDELVHGDCQGTSLRYLYNWKFTAKCTQQIANEEHQFLFAVNIIYNVERFLSQLRYVISYRRFVKAN